MVEPPPPDSGRFDAVEDDNADGSSGPVPRKTTPKPTSATKENFHLMSGTPSALLAPGTTDSLWLDPTPPDT